MDIQIANVHPDLTEGAIKRGLRDIIDTIAKKFSVLVPFNYLVVLEKFQEDLDFDKYDNGGKMVFNHGVITIPHKATAEALFATLQKDKVTVLDIFGTPRLVDAQKVVTSTLLPGKISDLAKESYVLPQKAEAEASKLSGNFAIVDSIELGFFNELGQFSSEASCTPVGPFNYVSYYSDYMPKKFQIGISYKSATPANLWTGEYMDIPANSVTAMLGSLGARDQVTELIFILKGPPKFLARRIVKQKQGTGIIWQPETILDQTSSPTSPDVEYQRIACPTGVSPHAIQLSRVVRLVIKSLKTWERDPLLTIGGGKFQCLPRLKNEVTKQGPVAKLSITELETAISSAPQALIMQISKLWMNGFFLPADILGWLKAKTLGEFTLDLLAKTDELELNELFKIMCRLAGPLTVRGYSQVAAKQPNTPAAVSAVFLKAKEIFLKEQKSAELANEVYPRKPPKNKAYITIVSIFPSHCQVSGPVLAESNRILRMYPKNTSNFIQVNFCDNDGGRLRVEPGCKIDEIVEQRVVATLHRSGGVLFGTKIYYFLGFSNSSLKANSQVWMMRGIEDIKGEIVITADTVRSAIGDWKSSPKLVQEPSKWAARMAQAYTKTIPAAEVAHDKWIVKDDISVQLDENTKYDFTDGIGYISRALMNRINLALKMEDPNHVESCAFQIRAMGAKGVVCLADDKVCGGLELVLRKSMVKFERPVSDKGKPVVIEVGIVAKVMKAPKYNRQLIQFLGDLEGKADTEALIPKVIQSHFKAHYDSILSSTTNEMERLLTICRRSSSGQNYGLQSTLSCLATMKLEATILRNTFLGMIIQRLQKMQIEAAKFETRIPIPGSFKVLGVCDEYGVLNEGEVYVRAKGQTISGNILIYRSPVIHPGDIRPVIALTDDAIKKIVVESDKTNSHWTLTTLDNVVVFSVRGKRPLPTMLAGGDLDGDLYDILTTESKLVLDELKPFPPPSYLAKDAFNIKRDATIDDIADFIGRFIIEECMGLVTNTQLTIIDQAKDGTRDEKALKYSEACSLAVDFQKSGNNADFNKLPRPSSTAKPDFLRSIQSIGFPDHRGEYYESSKLLGRLFRSAPKEDMIKEDRFTLMNHKPLIEAIGQLVGASINEEGRVTARLYRQKVLEYFKQVYRPRLDLIYADARLCSITLDEIRLVLLHADSEGMESEYYTLADRMVSLVASFDDFVVVLISLIKKDTGTTVHQPSLLFDMWTYLANPDDKSLYWYADEGLPQIGDGDKRFGISLAYLALNRFLYMNKTKLDYYKTKDD